MPTALYALMDLDARSLRGLARTARMMDVLGEAADRVSQAIGEVG